MFAVMFDTLQYVETLTKAGISDEQARAQLTALSNALNTSVQNMTNQNDLKELETLLESKIVHVDSKVGEVENHLKAKIDKVDNKLTNLDKKIDEVEEKLTQKIELLHNKIDHVEEKLTQKIEHVKEILNNKIGYVEENLSNTIEKVRTDLRGEAILVRWMLGFLLTTNLALLIKILF